MFPPRLTMVNVFPAARHEGQEEDFAVQAEEAAPASHLASAPLCHQLDGRQHIIVLDGGDDLIHAPEKKKQDQ